MFWAEGTGREEGRLIGGVGEDVGDDNGSEVGWEEGRAGGSVARAVVGSVGGLGGLGGIGEGIGGLGGLERERSGGGVGGAGSVPGRETERIRVCRCVQESAPALCSCCAASQKSPSNSTKVRARIAGREVDGRTNPR